MRRARSAVAALLVLCAGEATSQIIRPTVVNRPQAYATASLGWLQTQLICSKSEDACWDFGGGAQYRGSIEYALSPATAIGFTATTARMPMRWGSAAGSGGCVTCDADVTVSQYLATLHLGANRGLQQLIDVSAGVTQFSDFKSTAGAPLGSGKAVTNFTFAIALGIGFNVTPRIQMFLSQEYGVIIHERSPGIPDNSAQQQVIRIGGRYAFGGR